VSQFVLPGNYAASCTEPPSGLLLALLFFKDYKTTRQDLCHERHHGTLRHYDFGVTMSLMLHGVGEL